MFGSTVDRFAFLFSNSQNLVSKIEVVSSLSLGITRGMMQRVVTNTHTPVLPSWLVEDRETETDE